MRRLWLAGLTALCIALTSSPAFGAVIWTLVGTPLTATTGQLTTFTLTATNENLLQDIRCIRLGLGQQFAIDATSVTSVSNGGAWTSSSTTTTATVWTSSGGDRLRFLQSLRFTVRARPLSPGAFVWSATAYEQEDCSRPLGLSLQLDAVVVTGVAPTPVPTQTATPMPTATATPAAGPLVPVPTLPLPTLPLATLPPIVAPSPPLPTLPPLLPSLPPLLPTPTPGVPGGAVLPAPSSLPSVPSQARATPTPEASASPVTSVAASGAGGGDSEPPANVDRRGATGATVDRAASSASASELIVRTTRGADVAPLEIPVLGSVSLGQLWWVPAATIGGPGLLVILFIALQLVGGVIWLPATRRFRRNPSPPTWTVTSVSPTD